MASTMDRIDLGTVKRVMEGVPYHRVSEGTSEEFAEHLSMMNEMLELEYSSPPDLSNNAAYGVNSRVVVNGKVVATLDNNGFLESSNDLAARLGEDLPGSVNGKSGPNLAAARAKAVAEALGGKVVVADTAITQSAWEKIPTPTATVDREAMTRDPLWDEINKLKAARTLFLARSMGSGEDAAG